MQGDAGLVGEVDQGGGLVAHRVGDGAALLMTTGSRGLHVTVPLNGRHGFDEVRDFARDVADTLAGAHPGRLTTAARKKERGDRLYLDVRRNAYARTAVAPFSVRARPGPARRWPPRSPGNSSTTRPWTRGAGPSTTPWNRPAATPGRTCGAPDAPGARPGGALDALRGRRDHSG